jgi:hypothetical protein
MIPAMNERNEAIAAYISKLAGPDAKEREAAAYELFRLGCAAAEPVLRQWFADPEFRALAAGKGGLLTVGIALYPRTFEAIRAHFGQPKLADVPAEHDVLEFELVFPHGVRLDILTARTSGGEGPIAKFLARFGEGIQQVECDVRDAQRAAEILQRRFGLEPLYPEVRAGANQTRVNFFLVPVAEGRKLLIELVETPQSPKKPKAN